MKSQSPNKKSVMNYKESVGNKFGKFFSKSKGKTKTITEAPARLEPGSPEEEYNSPQLREKALEEQYEAEKEMMKEQMNNLAKQYDEHTWKIRQQEYAIEDLEAKLEQRDDKIDELEDEVDELKRLLEETELKLEDAEKKINDNSTVKMFEKMMKQQEDSLNYIREVHQKVSGADSGIFTNASSYRMTQPGSASRLNESHTQNAAAAPAQQEAQVAALPPRPRLSNASAPPKQDMELPLLPNLKCVPWKKLSVFNKGKESITPQIAEKGLTITVMHWNIRANENVEEALPKVQKQFLKFEFRFKMITQHIKDCQPDVFGLNDVDAKPIQANIIDTFKKMGYDYYLDEYATGLVVSAIFYKSDKFECIDKNVNYFDDSENKFLYCILQTKDKQENQFIFAETHFRIEGDRQEKNCETLCEYFKENYSGYPVLLGGDFNMEPQNEAIKTVMGSHFTDLHKIIKDQTGTLDEQEDINNHQAFTTHKINKKGQEQKRTVDYLFLANSENQKVIVHSYADCKSGEVNLDLEKGYPSQYYPSDHLALGYKVQIEF